MAGTFVLTDTLDQVFDDLFAEGNAKVDAQVQGEVLFSDPFGGGDQRALLDPELVDEVAGRRRRRGGRALRRSPSASGATTACSTPTASPIGSSNGPPTLLESWISGQQPHALHRGGRPRPGGRRRDRPQRRRRRRRRLRGGRQVTLVTQFGSKDYTLVGTVLFGTAESSAGRRVGRSSPCPRCSASPAPTDASRTCSPAPTTASARSSSSTRIEQVVPTDVEVLTGEEATAQISSDVQSGLRLLQAGADDLRRHRPAGRDLRHLQHLLDPRRAAHARAGAAPCRRRRPRPGARAR